MRVGLGVETLIISVENLWIVVLLGKRFGWVIIVARFELLHCKFI